MTKTYSVAFQRASDGIWFTNWGQYFNLDEINWPEVEKFATERGHKAYGYYYGTHSRNLTSARCRTVLKEFPVTDQA
jgi:hypothetical protein